MPDAVGGGRRDQVEVVLEHPFGLAVAADQHQRVHARKRGGEGRPVVVVGHGSGEADHLDPRLAPEQLHDLAAQPPAGAGHRDPGHAPIIQCAAPR